MERIRTSDNFCATIRWSGKLIDSKGGEDDWYGVEWDDPSRGKHNGEYKGEKLFDVSVPNSGSFLRASSVKKSVKISDIIHEYSLVGGSLSLDSTNVSQVGTFENFPEVIKTVNVAYSLVGSFQFIWDLLSLGKNIECLTMGRVHFVEFPKTSSTYNLQEIVLNDTNILESQLEILLKAFPNLKSIDISNTKIRDFKVLQLCTQLETIKLNNLEITSFADVIDSIESLPNIKNLYLNNNLIKKIEFKQGKLQNLESLSMTSNKINELYSLDEVTKYTSLIELRINRNPLQETKGEVEARLLVIARYPQIKKLNGSDILDKERRDSEVFYLNHFANDVYQNGHANHPIWEELVKKYGEPAVTCVKKEVQKTVNVILEFDGREEEESLMTTITVEKVIQIAQNLFELEDEELEIVLEYKEYRAKLKYTDQTLNDVGCIDGSILHLRREGEADQLMDELTLARSFRNRSMQAYARGGF